MKLALVYVNRNVFPRDVAPLGLCFIASYLRKYGNFTDVVILDQNVENIYDSIKKCKPDIVGVSSATQNFQEARRFIDFVNREMGVPIIVGGVHISIMPSSLPKNASIGVIGEGEETMLELMQIFDRDNEFKLDSLRQVKGICYYENDVLKINEPRPLIQQLDKIPHPDRSLLNMKYYMKKSTIVPFQLGVSLHMITSRGCPYHCVYCSTHSFWKIYREFSADWVMEEMHIILENYGKVEIIHLYDDLFLANKKRFFEIVDRVKKEGINKHLKFMCLGRTNLLNDEVMQGLKDMNFVCIGVGMESGSERILNYLKANSVTVEQHRKAIAYCIKYRIVLMPSFMIGSPGETEDDLKQTLSLIAENRRNVYFIPSTYVTTPLPATPLWDEAVRRGLVSENTDWEALCLDLPETIEQLKTYPLMIDMDVEKFFGYVRMFAEEGEAQLFKNYKINLSPRRIKLAITKPRKAMHFMVEIVKNKLGS